MPQSRKLTRPAILLYLGLALVACGPSSSVKEEPPLAFDACALLSPQDAKELAGFVLTGTASSTFEDAIGRNVSTCLYSTGSTDVPRTLGIDVRQAPNPEAAESRLKGSLPMLQRLSSTEPREVSGAGKQAFWIGGDLEQLHVVEGRFHVIVTAQTGERQLEIAQEIARRALARLQELAQKQKKAA